MYGATMTSGPAMTSQDQAVRLRTERRAFSARSCSTSALRRRESASSCGVRGLPGLSPPAALCTSEVLPGRAACALREARQWLEYPDQRSH